MWRVSGDVWDDWFSVLSLLDACRDWANEAKPGAWPDADIIPLGAVREFENGWTRLSPDEQFSSMTLHLIARSPLMVGGHLPRNDEFTLSLLTNREALDVNQRAVNSHELWRRDGFIVWASNAPTRSDRYVAVFNTLGGERIDAERALYRSPVISPEGLSRIAIDVNLSGAKKLYLVVDDGGDGDSNDHAAWLEPTLIAETGARRLTDLVWTSESAGYRYSPHARVNQNLSGNALILDDKPVDFGIGTHAVSIISYDLPGGTSRFKATGVVVQNAQQVSESPSRGSVRFMVFTEDPVQRRAERGRTVRVDLSGLGLNGPCKVRDIWRRQDLGISENVLEATIPGHGAGLYRLSPAK